jgi:uncharacterized protein YprB with RNaseH-like and TPR domain
MLLLLLLLLQVEVVAESLDQVLAGQHVDLLKVVRRLCSTEMCLLA